MSSRTAERRRDRRMHARTRGRRCSRSCARRSAERGTPARTAALGAECRGRSDHAVILVADLARASAAFTKLGFSVSPGGAHTGLGTHNAVVRFGVDYLELLAIRDEEEALRARGSTAPIVQRLRSGSGGLASFELATADIARDAERLREAAREEHGPFAMDRPEP